MKRKLKGAISVFLAIIYMWVFILEALLVDGGRMRLAEAEAEAAQQMANESALTLYNQALYQYYDLFGETKYTTEQLKPKIEEMMKTQLGADGGGSYEKLQKISASAIFQGEHYFNPYRFDTKVTVGSNINLADEAVFRSQVSDSMKYKGPVLLAQNMFDVMGKVGSLGNTVKAVHDSTDKVKGVYDDYGKLCDDTDSLIKEIKDFTDNPIGNNMSVRQYAVDTNNYINEELFRACSTIKEYSREIFEINVEVEGESEEDAAARQKKIQELREKKDKVVEEAVKLVNDKGKEFLDKMSSIENKVGDEQRSKGILYKLKQLEDKGKSYIGSGSNYASSMTFLNDRKDNVPDGDYSGEEKKIYGDFQKGVSDTKKKMADTVDYIQKYSDRIINDKYVKVSPKYDEMKKYFETKIVKSATDAMKKYREESVGDEMRASVAEPVFVGKNLDKIIMNPQFLSGDIEKYVNKTENLINYMKTPDYPLDYFYKGSKEERKKWQGRENNDIDSTKTNSELLGETENGKKIANLSDGKSYEPPKVESNDHKLGKITKREKGGSESKDTATEKVNKKKKSKEAKEDNAKEITNMSDKIGQVLSDGLDSLFESAYVMSNFRDSVHTGKMKAENIDKNKPESKEYDTVLNTKFLDGTSADQANVYYLTAEEFKKIEVSCAEVEYVLYGFEDTKKDVAAVYADIYLKRLALDYVSVWLTDELRETVMQAAAAAGPAAPIVMATLPLLFSVPRSIADMSVITSGKKCPLIYREMSDWVAPKWDDSKLLCGYGDYLLFGLLLDGNKTKRMMDVVETNMKELDSNFTLKKALVDVYVDSECSIDHLFMAQPFIPEQFRQGKKHNFRVATSFSY